MPYILVEACRVLKRTCCFHHSAWSQRQKFPLKIGKFLAHYMKSQRTSNFISTAVRYPNINITLPYLSAHWLLHNTMSDVDTNERFWTNDTAKSGVFWVGYILRAEIHRLVINHVSDNRHLSARLYHICFNIRLTSLKVKDWEVFQNKLLRRVFLCCAYLALHREFKLKPTNPQDY
jgi:hypothetical protein